MSVDLNAQVQQMADESMVRTLSALDYVTVDTVRVARETFAAILVAWRDGYSQVLSQHTRYSLPEVQARFNELVASIQDPRAYVVWQVPIVSATVPEAR